MQCFVLLAAAILASNAQALAAAQAPARDAPPPPAPRLVRVHFGTSQPLGLKLGPDLSVIGFHRERADVKMAAESSGKIHVGDLLVAVNQVNTTGRVLSDVQQLIREADLPKALDFRTVVPAAVDHDEMPAGGKADAKAYQGQLGVVEFARGGSPLLHVPVTPFRQAYFGGPIRCSRRGAPLVLADPPTGCMGHTKAADVVRDSYLVVRRGQCSFADKAILAQQASALGLIVVGTDDDVIHMPWDPSQRVDVALPAVMVPASSLRQLIDLAVPATPDAAAAWGALVASKPPPRHTSEHFSRARPPPPSGHNGADDAASGEDATDASSSAGGSGDKGTAQKRPAFARLVVRGASCPAWSGGSGGGSGSGTPGDASSGIGGANASAADAASSARSLGDPRAPGGLVFVFIRNDTAGGEGAVADAHAQAAEQVTVASVTADGGASVSEHHYVEAHLSLHQQAAESKGVAGAAAAPAARALAAGQRWLEVAAARYAPRAMPAAASSDAQPSPPQSTAGGASINASSVQAALAALSAAASVRGEYLRARFGREDAPTSWLDVLQVVPPDACEGEKVSFRMPASWAGVTAGANARDGLAALVHRGKCSVDQKLRAIVQAANRAGGDIARMLRAVVVASHEPLIVEATHTVAQAPPLGTAGPVGGMGTAGGAIGGGVGAPAPAPPASTSPAQAPLQLLHEDNVAVVMVPPSVTLRLQSLLQADDDEDPAAGDAASASGHAPSPSSRPPRQHHVEIVLAGDARRAAWWDTLAQLQRPSAWAKAQRERRKLYMRLARLHHPDGLSGDADRFDVLQAAYQEAERVWGGAVGGDDSAGAGAEAVGA